MKKILALSLLILPLTVFAADFGNFEDFGVEVPQWKDFAPPAFVDVKQPRGLGKLNVNTKYWYARRVAFDEAINACKELETNNARYNCYEKVRVSQYTQNTEYNARIEAKNNPQIPEMQNPTDSMIPIGGYINNMTRNLPNEFH